MARDAHQQARARMAQLIDGARVAVGNIGPHPEATSSTAVIQATWTASRAAGFLEACALIDPVLAGELLTDFESVASLVDDLDAARRFSGYAASGDGIVTIQGAETTRLTNRRGASRRVLPDRRMETRRQVADRRAG